MAEDIKHKLREFSIPIPRKNPSHNANNALQYSNSQVNSTIQTPNSNEPPPPSYDDVRKNPVKYPLSR